MHARFQELISLRDGEPVDAGAAQHVAECGDCGAELARLARLRQQLQTLPDFQPLPHNWSAIQERLNRPPRSRMHKIKLPLAATAFGAAALLLLFNKPGTIPAPQRSVPVQASETIEPLVARSQQLEALLQELPRRPSVERAGISAAIDELQNQIQILDMQLNSAQTGADRAQAQRLWSDRVQLLNSLVSVRYAEAARGGYWATTGGAI